MPFNISGILSWANSIVAQASKREEKRDVTSRRIVLDPIKIEGKVQKPEAFYVMSRGKLPIDALDLRKSFLHKIFEAVDKEPF